jgi:AraC-like DNA-binding protein
MYYSRDLSDALHRFSRYIHIISEAVQFEVARDGERTTLSFNAHPSLLALRHPVEAQLAAVLTIARDITQSDVVPRAIHLPSPKADDPNAYREVFRCPVHFSHPNAAIVFATSQMRLPIKASDPTLSGYLEELAGNTLKLLGAPSENFVDTVRRVLWSELPGGRPNLWRTASGLGISARTLQRRLRENGSSFSAVLEELRRELSGDLLADKKLAVSDVAFLLGYSEPSAFRRAFRRWRGVSPRRFRSG